MKSKVTNLILSNIKKEFIVFLFLFILEVLYVHNLYRGDYLLAGGDNYTYLQLGRAKLNPYAWHESFGGQNFALPDLFGIQLYSVLFGSVSQITLQKLLIFVIRLLRYLFLFKLIRLFKKDANIIILIPSLILYSFNPFESLDPFSIFPMIYKLYLPMSLYFFIKLIDKNERSLFLIFINTLVSLIFTPIYANLPLAVTIFIPQIIYLLFVYKSLTNNKKANLLIYAASLLLINFWWFVPMLLFFISSSKAIFSSSWFNAVGAGDVYSNLRFIGQWGWYSRHFMLPYYSFSTYYDLTIIKIFTYFISGFALIVPIIIMFKERFVKYLLTLTGVSLVLMSGSSSPFGYLYLLVFNYVPGFKMFREPFTKFGGLYVFSVVILLVFSVAYTTQKFTILKTRIVVFLLTLIILISGSPVLLGEHVWDKWNGSMRTLRVKIPTYWKDFRNYAEQNLQNTVLITYPRVQYGGAWNWQDGISLADDVLVNFVGANTRVLRGTFISNLYIYPFVNLAFDFSRVNANFFRLLGVDYIVRQNDIDWRYSSSKSHPPEILDQLMSRLGFELVTSFGKFDRRFLVNIVDLSPDPDQRFELFNQLLNRTAIDLYRVPKGENDKVVLSDKKIYVDGGGNGLLNATTFESFKINDYILVEDTLADNAGMPASVKNVSSIYLTGTKNDAAVLSSNQKWLAGWAWPNASINPNNSLYSVIQIKEKLVLAVTLSKKEKISVLTWYSAKRVAEIEKYNPDNETKKKITFEYIDTMSKAAQLAKEYDREAKNKESLGSFQEVFMYMKRGNMSLDLYIEDSAVKEVYHKMLSDYYNWLRDKRYFYCSGMCYDFRAPQKGSYDLYIDKITNDFAAEISVITLDGKPLQTYKREEAENNDFFDYIGTIQLEFPEQIQVLVSQNLDKVDLITEDWKVYEESNLNLNGIFSKGISITPSFTTTKNVGAKKELPIPTQVDLYSKEIIGWDSKTDYLISFDYTVIDGLIGFAVVERYPDNEYRYLVDKNQDGDIFLGIDTIDRILVKRDIPSSAHEYGADICSPKKSCTENYDESVHPGLGTNSAYIVAYVMPDSQDGSAKLNISNLKVERILQPNLMLVQNEGVDTYDTDTPDVEYEKINPSLYRLKISSYNKPLTLIFNENYDSGWKLKIDGKVVSEKDHIISAGFKNSWLLTAEILGSIDNKKIEIFYYTQKYINAGLAICIFTITILFFGTVVSRLVRRPHA